MGCDQAEDRPSVLEDAKPVEEAYADLAFSSSALAGEIAIAGASTGDAQPLSAGPVAQQTSVEAQPVETQPAHGDPCNNAGVRPEDSAAVPTAPVAMLISPEIEPTPQVDAGLSPGISPGGSADREMLAQTAIGPGGNIESSVENSAGTGPSPVQLISSPEVPSDEALLARSLALWREIEPDDPRDAVSHLVCQEHVTGRGARLVAASRRGRSHAHEGKYREDAYHWAAFDEWVVVAVTDGAGSKPLARVGARLAAEASVSYVRQAMKAHLELDVPPLLRGALAGGMMNALARIHEEAARRRCDPDDLATTLILVACSTAPGTQWLGIAQVGDGGVAAQRLDGGCTLLTQGDHGSFGGATLFLTSHEAQLTWMKRVRTYEVAAPAPLLLIATDGVLDDFTPPFGDLSSLFVPLRVVLQQPNAATALLEWLAYARRSSYDDRTLVALMFTPIQTVSPWT